MKDRHVIVTGGADGIGKAIAQRFLNEGSRVTIFDIKEPDLDAEYYKVDICKEGDILKAVRSLDTVDILVNNAGIYFQSSIEETSCEDLDRIIDINIKGTYLVCKHIMPLIRKSHGNVINIASSLGMVPEPESPAYCASKSAIIMLTKCLAQEYASKNVRVNAVLPGPIETQLLTDSFQKPQDRERSEKKIPLGRIGTVDEVANVVYFLSSGEASYVTGGLYSVDGGESTSSVYSK